MDEQTDQGIKKTYYSISEVCARTNLEPHVLRYWESEFPQLRPKKNRAGNRAYRDKDIETIEYIKFLLYDQQFTIPGAKKKLSEVKENDSSSVHTLATDPGAPAVILPVSAKPENTPVPTSVDNTMSADLREELLGELRSLLTILQN